ncbi:response regulator [Hyunsoonleella pacifica]|uniref:Response regulator transcription factor n=1 Tax=Hyunsoonleella pacifica TaxID=1080224 RepID=A0A4Q9FP41_9FLAO|nr:response regulator transcription factor [Hyunsoonleella pacifica]TBN16650.1 response regulator transcription factor [Hyunsoonleella pacifica]GGD17688.1 DNA-binding response regulator [Hyunsoonleella pacifica]
MESQPKKILICEDHQIVIDGLLSIFKNQPDYHVIGYINDGNTVISTIEKYVPDAILLDLNLPNKNGVDILKDIKLTHPKIKVIILTMYNTESIIKKVKQLNANGFLLKNCSSEDLFNALDAVFENNTFYKGKGVKNEVTETDGFLQKINITRREKEIIAELMEGLNVPEIAEKLFISSHTVETHKKNIFKKLNIHNSIDLVKLVNEKKLLS